MSKVRKKRRPKPPTEEAAGSPETKPNPSPVEERKTASKKASVNPKGLSKKELAERQQRKWAITVTVATFFSTMFVTYISDALLSRTPLLISLLILVAIIGFGICSDIVGVAITAVSPQPFNSMAAKRIKGAKTAVNLIKSAPKFSNICNDVVGDICGIVSGATGVAITAQLSQIYSTFNTVVLSLVMSGLIAAFTVGGKALGKDYAMKNSVSIIFFVAKCISYVKSLIGLKE